MKTTTVLLGAILFSLFFLDLAPGLTKTVGLPEAPTDIQSQGTAC
jgi:hypothetical protein